MECTTELLGLRGLGSLTRFMITIFDDRYDPHQMGKYQPTPILPKTQSCPFLVCLLAQSLIVRALVCWVPSSSLNPTTLRVASELAICIHRRGWPNFIYPSYDALPHPNYVLFNTLTGPHIPMLEMRIQAKCASSQQFTSCDLPLSELKMIYINSTNQVLHEAHSLLVP